MRSRFEIYCDILYWGLLEIRNHSDDAELCFAQADHLHNLPELLRNFDNEELHRFYWKGMRASIIDLSERRNNPAAIGRFQQLWDELEQATLRELPNCKITPNL